MSEIQHNREIVDALITKMKEVTERNNKVEESLRNLSNTIQSEFAGKAKESLVTLLKSEIQKLNDEKENWQKLIERAQRTAESFEEQDQALGTGGGSGGGGGALPVLQYH